MRRAATLGAALTLLVPVMGGSALAQRNDRDQAIMKLPRPGYEPKLIRVGQTVITPQVIVGLEYDDNIFATADNKEDDWLATVAPTVSIDRDDGKLKLGADLFGVVRHYFKNDDEAVSTYGIDSNASYMLGHSHILSAAAGAQRSYERRSDPEADVNAQDPPAKINSLNGALGYQFRGNRIGFAVRGLVDKLDYLPVDDADRDVTTYRGTARLSGRLTPRLDLFVEGYINKRDARTAVDRSGVDRDTTTKGVLAGVAVDIADRLTGDVGVGFFHSNPQDPTLRGFSGFAANGSIQWRPRVRTAITADVFRGDVATIRAGANGRIDTRLSLRVDQEVRHNLILSGGVGVRDTQYRGVTRSQTLHTAELETTYLVNRHIGLSAGAVYTKRTASQPIDEFERWRFQLATRFIY